MTTRKTLVVWKPFVARVQRLQSTLLIPKCLRGSRAGYRAFSDDARSRLRIARLGRHLWIGRQLLTPGRMVALQWELDDLRFLRPF